MYLENPIVPPVSRPTPSPRRTQELTTVPKYLVRTCRRYRSPSYQRFYCGGWERVKCRGMGLCAL